MNGTSTTGSRERDSGLGQLSSPVFVGRTDELCRLLDAVRNPPALALVEGEAGVGKSRLVQEMAGQPALQNSVTLVGRCHRLREPHSLGPLIEGLRSSSIRLPLGPLSPVAGALRPFLPELGEHLPLLPDPLVDPKAERHRVFRALRELFDALGPTTCVLEDLHWADEGTLDFLAFLLPDPPPRLTLVATFRREELDPASPLTALELCASRQMFRTSIDLLPLSIEDVRQLVCSMLGTDTVSFAFASHLADRTAGLPFAVEEVMRLLRDRGALCAVERSGGAELEELDVPPAIRHGVRARVAALSADAQQVVRAAAVLGNPQDEETLAEVAGLAPMRNRKALTQALTRAVLEDKGGLYGFRHALAAQAVYEGIHRPERRRLHLRAARALESRPGPRPLAQLATHFKEGGRRGRWARYAEAAAAVASSVGEDRAAARILEEVLRSAELSRTATTRLAFRLGDAALFGRVPRDAIRILRNLLEDGAVPKGVRGELRFLLARLLFLAGDASSHRELLQAVEELQRRPRTRARAMALLACCCPSKDDEKDQLFWLQRASKAAAHQEDAVLRTEVAATRANVLLELGDPAGWRAVEELPWSATSTDERLELVRASKYLAAAALRLGHHRRAESLLDEGDRIREELGHGRFAVGLATVRARLEWSGGHWQGLEARVRSLMDASAEAPGMAGWNEEILGWLLLARGRLEDAEESFLSALEVARKAGQIVALTTEASGLARIHLARGDASQARELATMGLDEVRNEHLWSCAPVTAPVAVDALLACGERSEAEDLVRRLDRSLQRRDAPAAMAGLAFCRGALAEAKGDLGGSVRWFSEADEARKRLPCPYEAGRARERRGRCLLAAGDDTGSQLLLDVLQQFHSLGATDDVARVRADLRGHGITVPYPWRGGPRGYGDELSPREAEVAHLASMGSTNREIADALFISLRTAENHVASVLKKLGLDSRRALADHPVAPPSLSGSSP